MNPKNEEVGAVWHGHHEAEFPLEFLTKGYDDRLDTINTVKAEEETKRMIAHRLKLFKRVEGELPQELLDAARAKNNAVKAYNNNSTIVKGTNVQFSIGYLDEIMSRNEKIITELHSKECGCPWNRENNNDIFNYINWKERE